MRDVESVNLAPPSNLRFLSFHLFYLFIDGTEVQALPVRRHQPRAHAVDLVRCARGVDVGYKEDSTSTTSTSTCIHRYPTFLPFGSSRSDGNRWMLKVYFLPSVEPLNSSYYLFLYI